MSLTRPSSRLRAAVPGAALLGCLLAGAAVAVVPAATPNLSAQIEPLSPYQPQTSCDPVAKPGALKLRTLLLATYPGTRSLGIVRACSVGGTSEHKEGRAFDWGVRVDRPNENAEALTFLHWLVSRDDQGNLAGNARRLGVQYAIYNHLIWTSDRAGTGWRRYGGPNPHTDHVHISLSRAGATGLTSFWTGRPLDVAPDPAAPLTPPLTPALGPAADTGVQAPPAPAARLAPGPPLVQESVQPLATPQGALTRGALIAGQRYTVEVTGGWRYGPTPGAVADAECSRTDTDPTWRADRVVRTGPSLPAGADELGLSVDGHDLGLLTAAGAPCDPVRHRYQTEIVPSRTGRVPLALWQPDRAAPVGANTMRVRITHVAGDVPLPTSWWGR